MKSEALLAEYLAKGGKITRLGIDESALANRTGEADRRSWGQFGSYTGEMDRTRAEAWFKAKARK